MVPSATTLAELGRLLDAGQPFVAQSGKSVSAALVPRGMHLDGTAEQFAALSLPPAQPELPLFEYGHDIIRHHLATLTGNLEHRIAAGGYKQLADGVFAAPGATLGQYVVTDTSSGPIVLEEGATIGPYCYLSGPLHVGPKARVLEYAALKDCVTIGHTTKIGGEVEASIIEPYTNKQHHGFLGHSYLGSWINLGAGTCNSDLKNTYGQVKMEYRGQKVPTGMQFVGAIVGDYAKTAINTGIFTGKTIGVCSMVYGFVTTNVPGFVNYARLFGQVTEAPVEVMVATQKRMFQRRGVAQRDCDIRLLHAMHALTEHERKQSGEALSLEPLSL
jgi:glucose-1-phosphate thymidylyltransferase